MPKFVIERSLPGAGKATQQQLKDIAQKSCDVVRELAGRVQWQHSYVTDDKVYCVYLATSEQDLREHARRASVPIDRVSVVRNLIDPTTAE